MKVAGRNNRASFTDERERYCFAENRAQAAIIKESKYKIIQNGQKKWSTKAEILIITKEAIVERIERQVNVSQKREGFSAQPIINIKDSKVISK